MVNSKAWDWKKVNNSIWDNPSEDSYYFLHRWKQKGFNNFLDLGCGKGRHSILFAENGFNVTAVDLSDYSVRELKELSSNSDLNIKCHVSDMVNLEYKDKQGNTKPDETRPEGKGKGLGKPGNKKQTELIQSTCKAEVKNMAKELESLYGKPRGQGWDGLWFTFRQVSDTADRGLKLYGHRCRTGMYSIIYTDEKAQRKALP